MPIPIVNTLIISKNPNSSQGPEVALTKVDGSWVIPGTRTPNYSHSPGAALAVFGASVIPGIYCEGGKESTMDQTGLLPEDFVYVDCYEDGEIDHLLYAILLRKDRMPLRYAVLGDCEFNPNWFFLNSLPEGIGFYEKLIRDAALKLKTVDSASQRALNAARTIRLFSESFGHSTDPIRPPKQADKRAAAWVNAELKSGTLNKEAVEECLKELGSDMRLEISGDRLNQLYRLSWRKIAVTTHKYAFI